MVEDHWKKSIVQLLGSLVNSTVDLDAKGRIFKGDGIKCEVDSPMVDIVAALDDDVPCLRVCIVDDKPFCGG